jgi:PAS domain S-box-containing protein
MSIMLAESGQANLRFGDKNMTDSVTEKNDLALQESIPEGMAPLESIIYTEELNRRTWRAPDYEKENRALVKLVSALADSPATVLQTLAETIMDITQCDSAGLSLLTKDGKTPDVCGKRFYWPAITGMWKSHVGGGTPRNFGPCGDVLDRNCTLLFKHFERRYPYLMPVSPSAVECLLVPFYLGGKAVGTIWGMMHSDRRKFDAEDDRVMASLGKFASTAYQALMHIEDLKFQVSEREKAEAAVRKLASGLEAKVRRLVDANIIGIFIWNFDGRIVEANEAFLHMVEYENEELVSGGMRWTDLTPPEWRDRDAHAAAEAKENGAVQHYEKEFFRKDGTRVPVMIGAALFQDGGNEGVAFVIDLSEQKRAVQDWKEAQQALQVTQMELARVSRLTTMGEMAASIAHEVNQPLTAVTNNGNACLRLLANHNLEPDVLHRALEEIVADGTRASAIITRIRAFLKKKPAEKNALDMNEVIHETLALAGRELSGNRVKVELRLVPALPLVLADRIQLQQVLLNLIINAIEAMTGDDDQARVLHVESGTGESGEVLVAVRDMGTGLGSEPDRIFIPFYTTKTNGMGMGLSISRSLVEGHGGRLWAGPNSPRGSVFSFTLPVAAESFS